MPLPGRLPNHKADKSLLLPSNCSKSGMYVHARAISWAKFHALWSDLLTHIDTMKPASDLCFECQTNTRFILQSANMSEEDKFQSRSSLDASDITMHSAKEAKAEWEKYHQGIQTSYTGTMHYSSDYAQNVTYPSNPQQPGPAYFKSARKCGILGVACEPLSFQINYLIDGGDEPGKGANATASMLHHLLMPMVLVNST